MARETKQQRAGKIADMFENRRQELWRFRSAIRNELRYSLKQEHWEDSDGFNLRPSRIQPAGRQLLQVIYHMAAQIARSEVYLDARPVDREGDPKKAEVVRQLLEHEIHSPRKLYHLLRYRLSLFGLAGRMACMRASFNPDLGRFGEVVFNEVDPGNIGWAKGYWLPHELDCPWMYEEVPMGRGALAAMSRHGWDVKGLVPDMELEPEDGTREEYPGDVNFNGAAAVEDDQIWSDRTRMVLWWEKNPNTRRREVETKRLHPDMRYMQCGVTKEMGCGWRSLPQWELERPLSAVEPGACEVCGGDAHRVDSIDVIHDSPAYPDGLLSVVAPGRRKLVYEGPWPEPTRSFPYLIFPVRDFPNEPMGSSVTSEMWTRQSQLDIMDRQAMEYLQLARPLWLMPDGADTITDAFGNQYYFGDDQGVTAWYKSALGASGVELKQPDGLPSAWPAARNTFSNDFERAQGTNDMSLDADRSRNIPVGTVRAMERIRELPVDQIIDRLRWLESIFFGCVWDIMRHRYTDERMWRMAGARGQQYVAAIRASEMPDMDVVVTASPSLARVAREEAETAAFVADLPPHKRRFVARALNVSPSLLQELEEDEDELMREAALNPAMAGGIPGGGPAGPAGGPPRPKGPPPLPQGPSGGPAAQEVNGVQ